jgi:hypothetical protein
MGFTVCPAAVVAAPVESVWELLCEPSLFDTWWDAHTVRIVPEEKASPGQIVYATATGLGRTWDVTLKVEAIYPERHQIQLYITLPLGLINQNTITCAALDATSCRVQFG